MVDECFSRAKRKALTSRYTIRPGAEDLCKKNKAGKYSARKASDDVTYVVATGTVPVATRRVTLSTKHCTCYYMDQFLVPCHHLLAIPSASKKMEQRLELFTDFYKIGSYVNAFGAVSSISRLSVN